jgi:large subunit ribosomal protein L23Ae
MSVAKVNALLGPNGEKKANVPLVPGFDALDVANEIGIISLVE